MFVLPLISVAALCLWKKIVIFQSLTEYLQEEEHRILRFVLEKMTTFNNCLAVLKNEIYIVVLNYTLVKHVVQSVSAQSQTWSALRYTSHFLQYLF